MKRQILLLVLFTSLYFTAQAQVLNYAVGDVVNDFTVTDIDGVEHNLYEYTAAGKHVYLDFFFTTCPPCQATVGFFNEFYDKYGCNTGDVICIEINNGNDNNAAVAAYSATYGGPTNHSPAVSNEGGGPAVDSDFGISAYPTYCLIGPDNKLKESDIWPVSSMADFEATFYAGFEPAEKSCDAVSSGIEDVNPFVGLSVYPNPASDYIMLSSNAQTAENISGYEIVNLLGETMIAELNLQGVKNHVVATEALASGLYLIRVYGTDELESTLPIEIHR